MAMSAMTPPTIKCSKSARIEDRRKPVDERLGEEHECSDREYRRHHHHSQPDEHHADVLSHLRPEEREFLLSKIAAFAKGLTQQVFDGRIAVLGHTRSPSNAGARPDLSGECREG